jgi:hypothetical protein
LPCKKTLQLEDNPIRLWNQFGLVTRAFLTTSTGGPEFLSHAPETGCARRSQSLISAPILGSPTSVPSNPRFKEMQINGHSSPHFDALNSSLNNPLRRRESASMLTRAGLLALYRPRRKCDLPPRKFASSFLSTCSISRCSPSNLAGSVLINKSADLAFAQQSVFPQLAARAF